MFLPGMPHFWRGAGLLKASFCRIQLQGSGLGISGLMKMAPAAQALNPQPAHLGKYKLHRTRAKAEVRSTFTPDSRPEPYGICINPKP